MTTTQNEMSGTQKFILEFTKAIIDAGLKAGLGYGIFYLVDKALDQGRTVDTEVSPSSCKFSCGTPSVQPIG